MTYEISAPGLGDDAIRISISGLTMEQVRREAINMAASHHKPMTITRITKSGISTVVERFEARVAMATPEQLARNTEAL